MKQHLSKQSASILSILLFTIAIMLSGNAFAAKPVKEDMATQAELDAAIATINSKISDITPPVYEIGDVLSDGSIVFWIDETGQHGLAAQPFDDASGPWFNGKLLAESLGPGWRLPTIHELNLLYLEKESVGGFLGSDYPHWSSTEYDADSAWYQDFDDGYVYVNDKVSGSGLVRAVRAF